MKFYMKFQILLKSNSFVQRLKYAKAFRLADIAERKGFEPSIRCRIHAFQACALSHSATSLVLHLSSPNKEKIV